MIIFDLFEDNNEKSQGVAEGWTGALAGGALGLFGGPIGALFGAWIGHALQEKLKSGKAKTQNLMDQGNVYQVYFDAKNIDPNKSMSYIEAFDIMSDLVKKPHDIEKYFDIVDSRTGNSVFKYRAKVDASNFLKKVAMDRREELRQDQLNKQNQQTAHTQKLPADLSKDDLYNMITNRSKKDIDEQGVAEGLQSFHNGMQVKLTPEYADRPDEVFTVSRCDQERGRCWIGDEQGRGWSATFDQLIPVEDDDDDMFENTPKMSAREKLQRAVDREKKQAQQDRTGLSGIDYDEVQRGLQGILDRTKPKNTSVKEATKTIKGPHGRLDVDTNTPGVTRVTQRDRLGARTFGEPYKAGGHVGKETPQINRNASSLNNPVSSDRRISPRFDRDDSVGQLAHYSTEDTEVNRPIPAKSVIHGYTVFWNPRTRTAAITRGGHDAEAALAHVRVGMPLYKNFLNAVTRKIDQLDDELSQDVAEGSLEEVDRRGFLKGLGAAAGLAAMGGAKAATSPDDDSWYKIGQPYDSSITSNSTVTQTDNQPSKLTNRISDVTGPNSKGEYLVTVMQDHDIVSHYVTKTPPASWMKGKHKAYPQVASVKQGVAEGNDDNKIYDRGYRDGFAGKPKNDKVYDGNAWASYRAGYLDGKQAAKSKQGVAEGSEHEGLVLQFLKSITPKELRYYSIRDNCGPAALHMMDWAKEKGIELHRVNGYFVADNVVYDKADFTKEMKHEFLQQGLDFNDPKSRQEFIASNPKYSKEWKKVPHYWLQDDRGTVYDPTGYIQFIKTGLAKDLDKSRYETVQGVAEAFTPGQNSPYDCGGADSEYGRRYNPHKVVNNNTILLTDPQERAEYRRGWDEQESMGGAQNEFRESETDFSKRRKYEKSADQTNQPKKPRQPSNDYFARRAKEKRDLERFGEGNELNEVSGYLAQEPKPLTYPQRIRRLVTLYQAKPAVLGTLAREKGADSDEQIAFDYIRTRKLRPEPVAGSANVNWNDVVRGITTQPTLHGQDLLNAAATELKKMGYGTTPDTRDLMNSVINGAPEMHRQLQSAYDKKIAKTRELAEDQDTEGVERAILHRIMVGHKDLLLQYGPQRVMQAVEEVAYNVGNVDEIGTSDVSAWVHQVKQILGAIAEAKAVKTRLDPACWTGKKIGTPKTKVKNGVRVNNCVPK